mmetsp:Transcript_22213/g.71602  ORF Transcript_22213/g.71602 Transcript_22213/m.71602 type:complete len:97 (+) Transcript_22213:1865-2155(+)
MSSLTHSRGRTDGRTGGRTESSIERVVERVENSLLGGPIDSKSLTMFFLPSRKEGRTDRRTDGAPSPDTRRGRKHGPGPTRSLRTLVERKKGAFLR